jgi:hypothetical protein
LPTIVTMTAVAPAGLVMCRIASPEPVYTTGAAMGGGGGADGVAEVGAALEVGAAVESVGTWVVSVDCVVIASQPDRIPTTASTAAAVPTDDLRLIHLSP